MAQNLSLTDAGTAAQLCLWPPYQPDPDFYSGIHPTKHCISRARWAERDSLPNLLRAVNAGICPSELYASAVFDNPARVAELWQSVGEAACWELARHGCLLL